MGSLVNLYPEKRDSFISLPKNSIEDSIRKDWEAVGNDTWKVLEEDGNQKNEQEQAS